MTRMYEKTEVGEQRKVTSTFGISNFSASLSLGHPMHGSRLTGILDFVLHIRGMMWRPPTFKNTRFEMDIGGPR